MIPKFLIDECLSPDQATLARERGFLERSHVTWLGKSGWTDWKLKEFILDQDWTFVTRNSIDFRGPAARPGSKGLYAEVELHAGLVCINGLVNLSAEDEVELFDMLLSELGGDELINQALEITLQNDGGTAFIGLKRPRPSAASRQRGAPCTKRS